jgi:phosphoenolpyruvate-protein phosphotransferase
MTMRKGVPVSPGVAVAPAYPVGVASREPLHVADGAVATEIARLEQACAAAGHELDSLVARVDRQVGDEEAAIFRAHRALLRDPALLTRVKARIQATHVDASAALQATLEEYAQLFHQLPEGYLQDRLSDLRDVIGRIEAHLTPQVPTAGDGLREPVILVAQEILPSQALALDRRLVAGIVTERGSTTGHAAILARSLGIPAVSGVRDLVTSVRTGDKIALDGREGHVYLNPGPEVEAAYRKLQREFVNLRGKVAENRHAEAVTPDGHRVELLANVNGVEDAIAAGNVGATGVGLFRTEYVFLTHPSVPDEEEQFAAYRAVVEAAPKRAVTIRSLDLGGDKQVPYLGQQHETNPFMGWRSVRLAAAYPELFETQLRAILRTALHGSVSLLFPMITTLEEVRHLKAAVVRAKETLRRQGRPFADKVPVGIMVEVPAAALCIGRLLREVDFVSIGSNDLLQYLMAADRDNPRVANLCDPFHPALLALLGRVIRRCDRAGKPVTVCGEMAGWPRCFLALFGLGLRRLSMSPAFLPAIKEVVRHTPLPAACEAARRALKLPTARAVRRFLTREVQRVWPDVKLLDVRK